MLCLHFLNFSVFFGLGNRHLRMSLSSGRLVVTKFSLNRIQDVIFELHYPHQRGKKTNRGSGAGGMKEKTKTRKEWERRKRSVRRRKI